MTTCAKCGDCCEAIYIGTTKTAVTQAQRGSEDEVFIRKHWRRISRREAALRRGVTATHGPYYVCLKFDRTTRLCTAHDERPPACRNYPWYGNEPRIPAIAAYKRCSFWHDIPRSDWPDDVIPLHAEVEAQP